MVRVDVNGRLSYSPRSAGCSSMYSAPESRAARVRGRARGPHRKDRGGARGCVPPVARRRARSSNGSDGIWRKWSREVRPRWPRTLRQRSAGEVVGRQSLAIGCALLPPPVSSVVVDGVTLEA
eukprot:569755-Pleurochrysis_carterae.AAC.1